MRGLVLEGGGVRGAYQIGAFMALKKKGIKFDGIVGTSIGSFNAAMLVAKKEKELLNVWENAEISDIFGLDKEFADILSKKKIGLGLIKGVAGIISAGGLKTAGLRKTLDNLFEEDEVRNSNIDFGLVTLRIQQLKPIEIFKGDIPKGKLKDYIIASCYLPVFKTEKIIDDANYFDGGIFNLCPVSMLVDKGYDEIYAIRLKGLGFSKKVKEEDSKITYIVPSRSLGGALSLDKNLRKRNIKLGYYDTLKVLKTYDGYEYIFKKRPESFYKFIARKIPTREIKRVSNFFEADSYKETIIRAVEYVLKREDLDELDIYKAYKEIKRIKKDIDKKANFVYKFIENLKLL